MPQDQPYRHASLRADRRRCQRTAGCVPTAHPATAWITSRLDRQVEELEDKIHARHRSSDLSLKAGHDPWHGPITASALVASIGDAKNFDGGQRVAAWQRFPGSIPSRWKVKPGA